MQPHQHLVGQWQVPMGLGMVLLTDDADCTALPSFRDAGGSSLQASTCITAMQLAFCNRCILYLIMFIPIVIARSAFTPTNPYKGT